MRFVIVTGMSGGGKRTALKLLEDIGFYCVDNLPIPLLDKFFELITMPNSELNKVALGVDVRTSQSFEEMGMILDKFKSQGYLFDILFMEASDSTILKRYKESRRMHPLSVGGRVEDGIKQERKILKPLKQMADYIVDTSNLLTRELKEELDRIFVQNKEYNSLIVNVMSFGFKNGIPQDADLVFDVRFLPNPYYIDELKNLTGNDKEVQDFVMNCEEAVTFKDKLVDMVRFLIPNYVKEGKYQLLIAIGCTGGKHRSVTLANELYGALKDQGSYGLNIIHRDIKVGK
ncbi:MAG: RNase adapter RapZ [Lachnospiraceae bacterium]|nr:RNase adapter RapZ [Lachnospiraceae bacterium]MBR3683534.1 RNase adapter RapZ [Lachnospiraceae bacterium]